MHPVARAFLATATITLAACSDDPSDQGATSTSSGAAGASSSAAGGAMSGSGASAGNAVGGDGGAGAATGGGGAAGAGGAAPTSCDDLRAAIKDWIEAHASCSESIPCERLDIPEDTRICDAIAAPGDDAAELDAMIDAWKGADCPSDGSCGFTPGNAVCKDGKCALEVDDSCEMCDSTLDPQCTVGNQNALNTCVAEHCLKENVVHPGFCDDSPQCIAAGGTCEETYYNDPFCADGARPNPGDWETNCPGGNLRNTCCLPWNEPCSFIAQSMTLSLDPFTCATPTGNGQPWTCLFIDPEQTTCAMSATLSQPLGNEYDADVTVTATLGSSATVQGVQAATGRTFQCSGSVAYDLAPEMWSCTACDGADCVDCTIVQQGFCAL